MAPVPVYVKGGVWTNLEDQIVKAAIQKYGTHQWSKIASLLQKKSAKQCEIRWNEYLNPRLNFTEFTKEEDGRLLELARKLPNQWRTIADAMGRTAQVCIDHYNELLEGDDHDSELRLGSSIEFKVGDINPRSETLTAKPDDVSLAEDEREMLAEARARLLNTQGKKATRKIRERMLEESKQIAQLQKRRELKQAGVKTSIRQGKKRFATELDYNADVVYEQAAPPGIYDTTKEDERLEEEFKSFKTNVDRRGLRGRSNLNKDSRHDKKKRQDQQEIRTEAKETNTLVDEYKKPPLLLSKPGTKGGLNTNDIEYKRQKILENSHVGAVFKPSLPLLKGSVKKEQPRRDIQLWSNEKSLKELFAMLPEPRNDFEIAFDEEEDEDGKEYQPQGKQSSKEEAINLGKESGHPVDKTANSTISLDLDCLRRRNIPLPSFRENPKDSYEQKFNELLACSMMDEPYKDIRDMQDYLGMVEEEMNTEKPNGSSPVKFDVQISSKHDLLNSIESRMESIRRLKEELAYIKPLTERNKILSEKICGQQLPLIRSLQHRYYVNYRMYQSETNGIQERRDRLKRDLES